jgi:hypothetical protein
MSVALQTTAAFTPALVAQVTPSSIVPAPFLALLWIATGLLVVAMLINQGVPAWRVLMGSAPAAPDDSPEGGYRTRHDCIGIHKSLNEHRERISQQLIEADKAVRAELKADISGLHRRIDNVQAQVAANGEKVIAAVSELSGQVKQMNLSTGHDHATR